MYIYIYALVFCVNLPPHPPWYGPLNPGPRHNDFNTSCKDDDSINQHSHQSTSTTGPQGGWGANHDHAQGGRGRSDAGAYKSYIALSRKLKGSFGLLCTGAEDPREKGALRPTSPC